MKPIYSTIHNIFLGMRNATLRTPSQARSASSSAGFTLIELLVTLAILAVFYGLVMVNFASWRGPQYVRVSANELATNLNKIHAYALSARNINGNPAQMYVATFATASPSSYALQGLAEVSGSSTFTNIETIYLPGGARIQDITLEVDGGTTHPACVQVAFSLPFGKAYMNPACDFHLEKTASQLDVLSNARLTISIGRPGIATTKNVVIDGVTGRVEVQ